MDLTGTVALVTGGARRVGRAIVLELAHNGCDIGIHYHHSCEEAQTLATEVREMGRRAATLAGDLADPVQWPRIIQNTVTALGRLDILINNASAFLTERPDTLDGFDPALWEHMMRVNLLAPVALCHHARHALAAHGAGRVVNLCDSSVERPWPDHLSYSATKAALAAMTKALARELAPTILVHGVAPGIAEFPDSYSAELRARLVERIPLGRAGTPQEVARLVCALLKDGDYITGQTLFMDGGRSLQ